VTDKINASINRLKEYRSAIITAAVAGQIDVTTYAKSGSPDRRLDAIQEEMGA
jgi:type I restriction enzyme S subunit